MTLISECAQPVVGPVRDVGQLSDAELMDLQAPREHGPLVLALACEGGLRKGPICIVSLSTNRNCYVFDVVESERTPGVVSLVKELLEDPVVVKVIHDSKMDVDALHRQLDITVVNVHDTQAWDQVCVYAWLENTAASPAGRPPLCLPPLPQVLTGNRSDLNDTLVRYGCSPNSERDSTPPWKCRSKGDLALLYICTVKRLTLVGCRRLTVPWHGDTYLVCVDPSSTLKHTKKAPRLSANVPKQKECKQV
jgi:hypothetical protein